MLIEHFIGSALFFNQEKTKKKGEKCETGFEQSF